MNDYPFGKQGVYNITKPEIMRDLTITEWLEQLSEPYRTQALTNTEVCPYPGNENKTLPSLFLAISMGFIWHQTPEGINYWSEVHDRAQKGEFN